MTPAPASPAPGGHPARSSTALQGQARWLNNPSTLAGVAGGCLAAFYGLLTLRIPAGTGVHFGLIAVAAVGLFTVLGERVEQRCLRTLRKLGDGELPPSADNLERATQEVFLFPDRSFLVNIVFWCGGTLFSGLAYSAHPEVTWGGAGARIAIMGLALGPITSTLAYLLLVARGREVVARIAAAGLSAEQVTAAWPPRRRQLRARFVWFTAVSVATPSLLVMDVWQHTTAVGMERLAREPDLGPRQMAADQLLAEGRWPLVVFVALVVSMGLAIAYAAGSAIIRSLRAITDEAGRIASGDLRQVRLIPAEDELWAAYAALAQMQRRLAVAFSRLRSAAGALSGSTGQLQEISLSNAAGAAEQMASLNEISATTEELAASAAQIADSSAQVAEMAERTASAARAGQQSCQSFSLSMARLALDNDRIGATVALLNKRVQQIGRVVEFIQDIGDKADLLALNAELEGTKAGEVGRGFSLVAAEMRRLAESVVSSAREIILLITNIRDRANTAVMATESGMKAMQSGVALADQLVVGLTTIVNLANRTSAEARSISVATQQQQSSTTQLAEVMANILRVTVEAQETGSLVRYHEALTHLSTSLHENVATFQLQSQEVSGG